MILLLVYPILMAAIAAAVLGAFYWLQRRAQKREDNGQKACTNCATLMYCSPMACPHCRTPNAPLHTLTWLGSTSEEISSNAADLPLLLAAKKRCPLCATRLAMRTPDQACVACSTRPFADPNFVTAYDRRVMTRVPIVLLATALLGAIPIVGLIPAVILYRIQLVSPFRLYVPRTANVLLRWGLRVLFFCLVLAQLMPTVGAISVPLMAAANWWVYRNAFLSRLPHAATASIPLQIRTT